MIVLLNSIAYKAYTNDTTATDRTDEIKPVRLALVLGSSALVVTAAHIQSYNSWWHGERSHFQIREDGAKALTADKVGHFYFTYLTSDLLSRSLQWSGFQKRNALLIGASMSLAFQLYVEVEDGFTKKLGFSIGDAVADAAGAFTPWLQSRVPIFETIRFKWSCYPSSNYKQGKFRTIIDDYESMYFWVAMAHYGLPTIIKSILPNFISIAIGYSVKGLDYPGGGQCELFLGLDYDFIGLPGKGSFLDAVKHVMNYIHFPAPAIRITPTFVVYGLKF
ncbi:MAG: DUF2279 domain-containing protein [Ignavibacteriales bacterium]|nr:DUF2279 domain-containing protein [Ignavibacteriales bacterium]